MAVRIAELEILIRANTREAKSALQEIQGLVDKYGNSVTPASRATDTLTSSTEAFATSLLKAIEPLKAQISALAAVAPAATAASSAMRNLVNTEEAEAAELELLTGLLFELKRGEDEAAQARARAALASAQVRTANQQESAGVRELVSRAEEARSALSNLAAAKTALASSASKSANEQDAAALRDLVTRADQAKAGLALLAEAKAALAAATVKAANEEEAAGVRELAARAEQVRAEIELEQQLTAVKVKEAGQRRASASNAAAMVASNSLQGGGISGVLATGGAVLGGPWGGVAGQLTGNLLGGVSSGLSAVAGMVSNLLGTAVSGAQSLVSGALGLIGNFFSSVGSSAQGAIGSVAGFFGEIAKGALTLTLAYAGFKALQTVVTDTAEIVIGFSADLERNAKSWEILLGSADMAKDAIYAVQQIAVATSFTFRQVESGTRQLIQGGFSIGEVMGGLLDDVQNVASSMAEPLLAFDHLTLALSQVRTAGHLTGEEMRQLRNAGVSIPQVFAEMSKETGKSTDELYKMQRANQITSEMFLKAFQAWSETRFGGLAAAQAKTFSGAMEQIRESVSILGSTAFKPLFERLSQLAQEIAKFATSSEGQAWAARIAAAFEVVLEGVGRLVSGFQTGLGTLVGIVQGAGHLIYEGLQWINPFARHSPSLVESVDDGVQRIVDAYQHLGRAVPDALQPAAAAMVAFREITAGGLAKIDEAHFEEMAKSLALITPAGPGAYREAQVAIRALREEAAALTPEIIAQKEEVYLADASVRGWGLALDFVKARLKDAEDALKPLDEEIKQHQSNILALNIQLTEAKVHYAELLESVKPLQEELRLANVRLDEANLVLEQQKSALKLAETGLLDLKQAYEDAQDGVRHMQEQLTSSKDVLGGYKDQLSAVKDGLRDLLETPLEGTSKFREAIGNATAQVARLNAAYLTAKANGANKSQLETMQKSLELARARVEALRAQQEVAVTLPEQRLKDLSIGGTQEISYEAKLRGVQGLQSQISPLERLVKLAQGQVTADEQAVHHAQSLANAAKDRLETANKSLDPQRKLVEMAQQAKDAAEAERDAAKIRYETAVAQFAGDKQAIADIEAAVTQEKLLMEYAQLRKQAEEETLQPLKDNRDEIQAGFDEAKTARDIAKTDLADLNTAQQALVNTANAWQQEIDKAAQAAKTYYSELAAAEAERKRQANAAKEGTQNSPGSDPSAGGVPSKFHEARLAVAAEFEKSKADFAEWVQGTQVTLEQMVPGLGGFFGRMQGLLSGFADTADRIFKHDWPGALETFWGTITDVADGLPEALTTWTHGFINWVRVAAPRLITELGVMIDETLQWLTGPAFEDLSSGIATWAELFSEWVIPTKENMMFNFDIMSTQLQYWMKERWPEYKERLGEWAKLFVDWVIPIWDELRPVIWDQMLKPMLEWVRDRAKDIGEWVLNNWVTPFVKWVFDGQKGLWSQLRPELIKFIWSIRDLVIGADAKDPLEQAGRDMLGILKDGVLDVVGTIAHEIWSAMMSALGTWVVQHQTEINIALASPMAGVFIVIGRTVGQSFADGIMQGLTSKWNELGDKMRSLFPTGANPAPGAGQGSAAGVRGDTRPGVPSPVIPVVSPVGQSLVVGGDYLQQGIDIGDQIEEGVNLRLEIASPSKVFERIGQNLSDGLNQGFASGIDQFKQVASAYGEAGKAYFSMGAGQNVRTGFSLNGARSLFGEANYQKWQDLFGDQYGLNESTASGLGSQGLTYGPYPEKDSLGKPMNPYSMAYAGYAPSPYSTAYAGYGPSTFGPPDTGRSYSYPEGGIRGGEPTLNVENNITLQIGDKELDAITVQGLIKGLRTQVRVR